MSKFHYISINKHAQSYHKDGHTEQPSAAVVPAYHRVQQSATYDVVAAPTSDRDN